MGYPGTLGNRSLIRLWTIVVHLDRTMRNAVHIHRSSVPSRPHPYRECFCSCRFLDFPAEVSTRPTLAIWASKVKNLENTLCIVGPYSRVFFNTWSACPDFWPGFWPGFLVRVGGTENTVYSTTRTEKHSVEYYWDILGHKITVLQYEEKR